MAIAQAVPVPVAGWVQPHIQLRAQLNKQRAQEPHTPLEATRKQEQRQEQLELARSSRPAEEQQVLARSSTPAEEQQVLARRSTPAAERQARNLKFVAELRAPVQEHNSKLAGVLLARSWKLPVLWRRVCSYPPVELVLELVWVVELQTQLPTLTW